MQWIAGGVTAALGFRAAGVHAGMKRSGKPDLALVVSDTPATAVGVLTTNRVQAAPVQVSKARLRSGVARAVLLNSGCANCLTGAQGIRDALALSREAAKALGIEDDQILMASTGLIGRRLPLQRLRRAVPALIRRISRAGHRQAAQAILTTDTKIKEEAIRDQVAGRTYHLGGMAKGAGMIAPHMATMLCVLTTDVAIARGLLSDLLRLAIEASFNRITVDGDMSTNDAVFILANGQSGVRIRRKMPEARQFGLALCRLTQRLAHRIVLGGEGATNMARIEVTGARTEAEAKACARQVATSSLVRTMLASGDPNVGRIAAAVGASGAHFNPRNLEIALGGVGTVVRRGAVRPFDRRLARRMLLPQQRSTWPAISIHLHAGKARAWMTTADLTEAYVRLNARYPT